MLFWPGILHRCYCHQDYPKRLTCSIEHRLAILGHKRCKPWIRRTTYSL